MRKFSMMPDWAIDAFAWVFSRYALFESKRSLCPAQWTIFLTEICNLNCAHCFLGDVSIRARDRLSINDIKELCLKNKKHVKRINLTGGEIFLLPDIKEICFLLAKETRLENLTLTTSGFFPDKVLSLAEEFLAKARTGLSVQISLDGPAWFHDEFRGAKGLFQKTVCLAQELNKKYAAHPNFERAYFCVALNKNNLSVLEETIDLVNNLGVDVEWSFMRSINKSVSRVPEEFRGLWIPRYDELMLTIPEMEESYHILTQRFWKKKTITPSDAVSQVRMRRVIEYYKTAFWKMPCVAGKTDVIITPQGQVGICEMTKSLASLKDYAWDLSALAKDMSLGELASRWGCSCAHECNINNALRIDKSGIAEIIRILAGK